MNSGFKYKFRQKAIKKATDQNRREIIFPNFNSIKTIGVVANDTVSVEEISRIFGAKVNVHVLEFIQRKRAKDEVTGAIFLNDLNFWGIPKVVKTDSFMNMPFDLLLNFGDINNDAIDFVCAQSKAKFKVSTKTKGKIYDLIISGTNRCTEFLVEIKRTLINFNTKT